MNLADFIPSSWRLAVFAVAGLAALGTLGAIGLAVEKHGYDKAAAVYQPKLDTANRDLGTLKAANDVNAETIRTLTAEAAANDALAQQYADRVAALNQQADDAAAAIRKLQNDDTTVAAYLGTRIPPALRGLLDPGQPVAGGATGAANAHAGAAAAR
ncbi:MAG: hypothetical protein P4M09_16755 [Devosia sp.]|nr:hypothetical protein [Devosia sp.]